MKYEELRRLAEAARTGHWTRGRLCNCEFCMFEAATSPDVILALLDERERLLRVASAAWGYFDVMRPTGGVIHGMRQFRFGIESEPAAPLTALYDALVEATP